MHFKPLNYQPDVLLHYFAALADRPWAMLLHSGFAEHPHSRFDILVADPRVTITTRGQHSEIIDNTQKKTAIQCSTADPFLLLQQQLNQLNLNSERKPTCRFSGVLWVIRL